MKTLNQLRDEIRSAMQDRNMTARRLSTISGVGYLTIRRFLNGPNDTTGEKLLAILNALEIEVMENIK